MFVLLFQLFSIFKGKIQLKLGNKIIILKSGTVLTLETGIEYELHNNNDSGAIITCFNY